MEDPRTLRRAEGEFQEVRRVQEALRAKARLIDDLYDASLRLTSEVLHWRETGKPDYRLLQEATEAMMAVQLRTYV